MAGVKRLADGNIRLAFLTEKPVDLRKPTVDELEAGIDLSCSVMRSDYRLSPTASDTVDGAALCSKGNVQDLGSSNYEGNITLFLMKDEDGHTDLTEDVAYQALKTKGTRGWLYEREGPDGEEPWAAADEVDGYEVRTDNPQVPGDRAGYIRRTIPLSVQNAYLGSAVAAGS